MGWEDRIVLDPQILVGKPTVRGTRISVELVVGMLADGWSEETILAEYPRLTSEDIRACLAYARHMLESWKTYAVPVPAPASHE